MYGGVGDFAHLVGPPRWALGLYDKGLHFSSLDKLFIQLHRFISLVCCKNQTQPTTEILITKN